MRAGATNIGDREQVQRSQMPFIGNAFCEMRNHLRVRQILLLRDGRHLQMHFHQPCDQRHIGFGDVELFAEQSRVFFAQLGMVAAASFGDVVEKRCEIQHLGPRKFVRELVAKRKFMPKAWQHEAPQIADHHQNMLVHRVDVEQVVLHLPGDAPKCGDVAAKHTIAAHTSECERHFIALQYFQEQAIGFTIIAKFPVDQMHRTPQRTQRFRLKEFCFLHTLQGDKRAENGTWIARKNFVVARGDVAVDDIKFIVDLFDLVFAALGNALKQRWQENRIHLPDHFGRQIVALHQHFGGQLCLAAFKLQLPG